MESGREALLTDISEALERTRDQRFERHLRMPRGGRLQTNQPLRERAMEDRRVLDYMVAGAIGLAASMAIGVADILIRH